MGKTKALISSEVCLVDLPWELRDPLRRGLTYENPAYESAHKFGRSTRGIPKYIRLYKEDNDCFSFPRGAMEEVFSSLENSGYELEIIDKTAFFDKKEIKPLPLWDYQNGWVDSVLSRKNGMGIAPPGSGKTIMMLETYAKLGQPCLWLTHTLGLANQTAKKLLEFTGEEAGIIGGGKEDLKHFTIGIIPTLVRRDLSVYKGKFGLTIVDEAHHCPSSTFLQVLSECDSRYRYGATATPYREDRLENIMFATMGPGLAEIDKPYLRSIGKLMVPTVVQRPTTFYYPYDPHSKKFSYKNMEEAIGQSEHRNNQIVLDVVSEAGLDNTCIVLVGRLEHGHELHASLSAILDGVEFIHSKLKEEQAIKIIDDFSEGKYKVLIATYKMLAEGFDYPPTNRLFLTAPFKGRSLIEQACGRIERVFEGKRDAIVYDYVDEKIAVLSAQAATRRDIYEINNNPVIMIR
jgi:superfamily II DNA or RNA helicase